MLRQYINVFKKLVSNTHMKTRVQTMSFASIQCRVPSLDGCCSAVQMSNFNEFQKITKTSMFTTTNQHIIDIFSS